MCELCPLKTPENDDEAKEILDKIADLFEAGGSDKDHLLDLVDSVVGQSNDFGMALDADTDVDPELDELYAEEVQTGLIDSDDD